MQGHTSYDENGPIIGLGSVKYSASTNLPSGRQTFELPTYLVASDESDVIIEYNGRRLTTHLTRNDYYGFGSSPETALFDAADLIKDLEGCNVDVVVVTRVTTQPCFISDDKPFYGGAQRVHHQPMSWACEEKTVGKTVVEFITWKNGKTTHETEAFFDHVQDLVKNDVAPSRKGKLHSIITRKTPATKSDFLQHVLNP